MHVMEHPPRERERERDTHTHTPFIFHVSLRSIVQDLTMAMLQGIMVLWLGLNLSARSATV